MEVTSAGSLKIKRDVLVAAKHQPKPQGVLNSHPHLQTPLNTDRLIDLMRRFAVLLITFLAFANSIQRTKSSDFENVFPERPPALDIRPAVEIGFQTERRFGYVVQSSTNLIAWVDLSGSIVSGSGAPVYRLFRSTPGLKTFYRLRRIQVMYPLPNFSCGETAILMWEDGSTTTNLLTFPLPGEFAIRGADRGSITEVDRDHNTLRFVARAEDDDAHTPYFNGEVYFKFETETNGLFKIFNPILGQTNSGSFITLPHNPVQGPPPLIENGFSGKALELNFCPNGWERFEFISETEVLYKVFSPGQSPLGNYSYDALLGELIVTFDFGWEFRITLGSAIAAVLFHETALEPWRTNHATFRIFSP